MGDAGVSSEGDGCEVGFAFEVVGEGEGGSPVYAVEVPGYEFFGRGCGCEVEGGGVGVGVGGWELVFWGVFSHFVWLFLGLDLCFCGF